MYVQASAPPDHTTSTQSSVNLAEVDGPWIAAIVFTVFALCCVCCFAMFLSEDEEEGAGAAATISKCPIVSCVIYVSVCMFMRMYVCMYVS